MNLKELEIQLKKRWALDYNWGRKQGDDWDKRTNFIYNISDFDSISREIELRFSKTSDYLALKNYAFNRWYNFWSAMAVEYIFNTHPCVRRVKNATDREKDFFINDIAFDHKTTVFPSKFDEDIELAKQNPIELLKWLYINQSSQKRFHLKNRLFVVLHKKDGQHWRLKAELQWIKLLVDVYLEDFDEDRLVVLKHSQGVIKTDAIFGMR